MSLIRVLVLILLLGIPPPDADQQRREYADDDGRDAEIADADALLISFAEHNMSFTAAWKNLYDWCSRIETKVYQGKPTVLLSTSPGGRGGANALEAALKSAPRFGADIRGSLSLPSFNDNFDTEAGMVSNPELDTQLKEVVASLK